MVCLEAIRGAAATEDREVVFAAVAGPAEDDAPLGLAEPAHDVWDVRRRGCCARSRRLQADAAYISLTHEPLMPGRTSISADPPDGVQAFVVLDWKDNRLVGIEVLDASIRLPHDFLTQAEQIG
jgi:hypothetical protein